MGRKGEPPLEAFFLLLDAIGMVLLAYWCVRNDGRGKGEKTVGLFRFPEPERIAPAPAPPRPASPPPIRIAR
jgi:hypothetical protein